MLSKDESKPLVKFDTLQKSVEFLNSFMTSLINMIPQLVSLNPDTDLNKSYGKALLQLAFTTWLTPLFYGSATPLTPLQIRDNTIKAYEGENVNVSGNEVPIYQVSVEIFTNAYELVNK